MFESFNVTSTHYAPENFRQSGSSRFSVFPTGQSAREIIRSLKVLNMRLQHSTICRIIAWMKSKTVGNCSRNKSPKKPIRKKMANSASGAPSGNGCFQEESYIYPPARTKAGCLLWNCTSSIHVDFQGKKRRSSLYMPFRTSRSFKESSVRESSTR